jgi:hypothetical protein
VTIKPLNIPREQADALARLPIPDFFKKPFGDAAGSRSLPDPPDASLELPSDVTIFFDPDSSYSTPTEDGDTTTTTPQVDLFHELVHASHLAEGSAIPKDVEDPLNPRPELEVPMYEEEARTIGRGGYGDGTEITENTLRDELGLPRRDHIAVSPYYADGPTSLRPGPA